MPDGLNRNASHPILLTTDAVGGVWRYTLDLAAGLAARGMRPVVAVLGPQPTQAQRDEAGGLELIETGLPLDWTAESRAELAHAASSLRSMAGGMSSVHLHAPALASAGQWPVPVVAVAHSCVATWWRAVRGDAMPLDFQWRTEASAAGLRAADAVIAPTASHAEALRAAYGPLAVEVVHNGSNLPPLRPSPSGRGLGETPSVLTAGRLWDEGKNASALDRVAPALGAPIRAAGPVRGANGAAVALPNLHLLGTLDFAAMADAYASATIFASLSRYEPFGLSVLEAARAGLRLVLSDIPTFRELWDDAAIFVRDEADLLSALRQALAGGPDPRARAARYTVDAMVEGTLAVHLRVGAPA